MAVFNGDIRTPRAVADPGTDHQLPPSGALSYGAMQSQSALAGTNGADVALVHGNKWLELDGNLTQDIHGNEKDTIDGNLVGKVLSNMDWTVVGNTADKRIGSHVSTNVAPRHDIYCHSLTETHHQPHCKQQPTSRKEVITNQYFDAHSWFTHTWLSALVAAVGINVFGAYGRLAGVYVQDNSLAFGFHLGKTELKALKTDIAGIGSDIRALHLHTAALKAGAVPLKALLGFSFKWNTPWS